MTSPEALWLNGDQISQTMKAISNGELNHLSYEAISTDRRKVLFVQSWATTIFFESSKLSDEELERKCSSKYKTRKDRLVSKLGLNEEMMIPFNQPCYEHRTYNGKQETIFNYEKYCCICFPLNIANHWSLLVYFFQEDYWIHYDSVSNVFSRNPRATLEPYANDKYAVEFLETLKREKIILRYENRRQPVRNTVVYTDSDFPMQTGAWECGYIMLLFFLCIYKTKGPIHKDHYKSFGMDQIGKLYRIINKINGK